jgi:acetolactate synthase-1/2/3 large subunit
MVPVIHEVAAVIAADYYNEVSSANNYEESGKAVALVTVGPGLTNTVTGVAGAFVDGRELLLIGGQVKTSDLKKGNERQRGLQEVDGLPILDSITKESIRLERQISELAFKRLVSLTAAGRKGPVYIEICLDVQGSEFHGGVGSTSEEYPETGDNSSLPPSILRIGGEVESLVRSSLRPIILIGGGVPRGDRQLIAKILSIGIPVATTWHAADRISSDEKLFAGRPNMFGQRWANVFLQQADLVISLGTTLGLQQTGFNLDEFAPLARVVQVDIDPSSMKTESIGGLIPVLSSIQDFVSSLASLENLPALSNSAAWGDWRDFLQSLKVRLPQVESVTQNEGDEVNPFSFLETISNHAPNELNFIPCSSGGSYTASMQVFRQKRGQTIVSSRGLGSMGIGLAGALGAALANGRVTWLVEGDGGIMQNIQEIGTIVRQGLPVKIIVLNNDGYASIRGTQKKYFAGNYVGCDWQTGLGLPNLELLAGSFGIRYSKIKSVTEISTALPVLLDRYPHFLEVYVPKDQTFAPKIESVLREDGTMVSNPLHIMHPLLDSDVYQEVLPWLAGENNE